MHADDGFDRSLQAFENHYFHCPGECTLTYRLVKRGLQVSHGMDYAIAEQACHYCQKGQQANGGSSHCVYQLEYGQFASADLHVHMNYGGHYHNAPDNLINRHAPST